MSYHGTTASSSLANPPMRIAGAFGGISHASTSNGGGRNLYLYNSSNPTTDMSTANFFTDAKQLGMNQGDIVMGTVATGSSVSTYQGVLGAVSTSGAALASSGGILSSTR